MRGFVAKLAWLLIAFAVPLPYAKASNDSPAAYRLGVLPYMAPRQTIQYYGPLANEMAQVLHRPVKLESQRSFTDFIHTIDLHAYDIALIQPFDYPNVVEKQGYIPLARISTPLVTQFYVRQDSHYHKLEDLRDTTIAMPPAKAANSRMALRALYDKHLIPGRDINIRYFNSHDSCLQQVWVGNVSACASASPPVRVFVKRMKARLRPIYSTPAIPHILFVAEPRVPAEDRARLEKLLIDLNQTERGRAILKNLGFPPFTPVKAGEYAIMRHYQPNSAMAAASAGDSKDYILGIFPYLSSRQQVKNYAPLLPALSRAAGKLVRLRTASDFGKFSDNLSGGKYDIVLVQPFDFNNAVQLGYVPLAGMKELLYGTFFVHKDSAYRQISDLKGTVIAMPPVESAQAHLGRHALMKAGLIPGLDVKIKYMSTHDSCLHEVQRHVAAACATSPIVLKMLPHGFANGLRQIGKTEKMPGVVFLAHQRLPAPVRRKLKRELLSLGDTPEGRTIINAMQLGAFIPVNADEYKNLPELGK